MRGETKQERFQRVVPKRVQRVLDSIRGFSQCSNKRMYEWNDQQMEKIWSAIEAELKKCRERYEDAEPEDFRL